MGYKNFTKTFSKGSFVIESTGEMIDFDETERRGEYDYNKISNNLEEELIKLKNLNAETKCIKNEG